MGEVKNWMDKDEDGGMEGGSFGLGEEGFVRGERLGS